MLTSKANGYLFVKMLFYFILFLIFPIVFSLSSTKICASNPNIPHAIYSCSGTRIYATCSYTCKSGYVTTTGLRQGFIRCISYNFWAKTNGCDKEECASLPDIPHAKQSVQCSHMFVSESCPITCEKGYKANGSPMNAYCIGANRWRTDSVKCEQIPGVRQFLLNIYYSYILKIISNYYLL